MRPRAETVAATLNGLIVILSPIALVTIPLIAGWGASNNSTTVRAAGASLFLDMVTVVFLPWKLTLPLALVAAWRTWVHATNRRERGKSGWRGVLEAGALGVGLMLLMLAGGIVTRPSEALPMLVVSGEIALLVGLAAGLFLYATGMLVLKVYAPPAE